MSQIITIAIPGPMGPPGPPGTGGGGVTDHGALTGLLDDDHTQYFDITRGDARYAPLVHTHTASDISDSTAVGLSVLTAVDAAAARTAIGAGTSSLALGTTNSTAKAGDYQPTAANISDSTAVGRSVLTAIDAAAARAAIGAGTSSLTLGTTGSTAAAGNDARLSDARTPTAHTHVATTDLTATGTKDATTFLRGDDTWAVPASGGGGWTAVDASETVKGIAEIATTTETNTGTDDTRIVTPLKLKGVSDTKANSSITISAGTGIVGGGDLTANRTFAASYGSASGTAVEGNDARVTADQAAGTASIRTIGTGALQAAAGNHTHTAANISDSTTVGRSVLTAVDAAAARTAIGAGTSSLALGTTNTTAKAGDYQPTAANISDSTATGRSLMTAADGATARGITGAQAIMSLSATKTATYTAVANELAVMNVSGGGTTLNLPAAPTDKMIVGFRALGATTAVPLTINRGGTATIGDTGQTSIVEPLDGVTRIYQYDTTGNRWFPLSDVKPLTALDARFAALSHTHTATQISDSTAVGRSVLTAVDAAAARTAIGAGTSSLALGTTNTTAKAGDYAPPVSSETVSGTVELATAAETTTGTDNTRAVHPAGLKVELDKKITAFADPNADRIVFWDDSAGSFVALAHSAPVNITGTALTIDASTETASGIVELATAAETTTGTDNTRAVHPAGLKVELDKKTNLLLTTTTQTGTAYTYVIGDAGTQVLHNNASAITATVPPNSSVAYSIGTSIVARQYGAGQVTIAPGAGVTLRSRGAALKTAGQYGGLTLTKINTDEWIVEGDATT